jgi:quinol monooxygenase YgiN
MIPISCFFHIVGRPLATTICMILVIIRMKVLAEKRKELSQTIASLIGSLRTEKGCRRCDFYRSMEDENELCILEEWDTRENLNSHLKSERFRVLRGAMNLLQEPYEKEVWDGGDQEKDEKICILKRRARKKQAYPGG